jgi:ABC-type branched-subunit amino acid transport system permease subunit
VIGGLGSIGGAIAAAVLVVGIDQVTTSSAVRLLVSSVGVLGLLLVWPGGLANMVRANMVRANMVRRAAGRA